MKPPPAPAGDPAEPGDAPVEQPERGAGGLPTYVSAITSLEEQVGSNVVRALQHDGAMGVLTVVQSTPAGQRIVSVPLNEELLSRVSDALSSSEEAEDTDSVPCIGFHCALPHRLARDQKKEQRRESKS